MSRLIKGYYPPASPEHVSPLFHLDDAEFYTISYAWGEPEHGDTIILDGLEIGVRPNLSQICVFSSFNRISTGVKSWLQLQTPNPLVSGKEVKTLILKQNLYQRDHSVQGCCLDIESRLLSAKSLLRASD